MTQSTEQERALADLRHMYAQMVGGMVKDSAQAKRIADGILSRAIQKLEQAARRAPAAPVQEEPTSKQIVLGAGALLGQPENTADNRHPDWHSAVAKVRKVYLAMLAAAPQPPEAEQASVSNGTLEAPVQLPEYGIDTANHAGIRARGYTEQQVRQLLAAHGIKVAP